MTDVTRRAFDEAIALGHHWAGEEHFLLALASVLAPLQLTPADIASAVTAHLDEVGPPFPKEFDDGCLSAPGYHTILGRAEGFALGAGRAAPAPEDFLAALFWDPEAAASLILERAGGSRSAVLEIVTCSGHTVPAAPAPNPLPAPAEREAVALGHPFVGDDHVLLALLADSDPPVPDPAPADVAGPNPRCRQLLGRAEGLAATLGHRVVGSIHGLLAYLWGADGQAILALEAMGTSDAAVLAELAQLDVVLPAAPLPQPDRTPWGEKVFVPPDRMGDVVARLAAELPLGSWGCNRSEDGREWVVAHATVDLEVIVADVLAS